MTVIGILQTPLVPAGGEREQDVRRACFAGSWYAGDRFALATQVDDLLARITRPAVGRRPVALISPHAGYRYSGSVAAAGYACLRGHAYKRVIVLAFSHRRAGSYHGVDVPRDLTAYGTPLGEVPIDREACDRLLAQPLFRSTPSLDEGEHSLEMQLPFLQRILSGFRLVPLYVGKLSDADAVAVARALRSIVDDDTLLVASSDFTHYGASFGYQPFTNEVPKRLDELAEQAAAPLLRVDYDGFAAHLAKTGDTICGRGPIRVLLRVLSLQGGIEGVRAARDTSGNMTGDWTSSVTYQSFAFARRPERPDGSEREGKKKRP
jgi:AmmeMemoRadiSam system protein B